MPRQQAPWTAPGGSLLLLLFEEGAQGVLQNALHGLDGGEEELRVLLRVTPGPVQQRCCPVGGVCLQQSRCEPDHFGEESIMSIVLWASGFGFVWKTWVFWGDKHQFNFVLTNLENKKMGEIL